MNKTVWAVEMGNACEAMILVSIHGTEKSGLDAAQALIAKEVEDAQNCVDCEGFADDYATFFEKEELKTEGVHSWIQHAQYGKEGTEDFMEFDHERLTVTKFNVH